MERRTQMKNYSRYPGQDEEPKVIALADVQKNEWNTQTVLVISLGAAVALALSAINLSIHFH